MLKAAGLGGLAVMVASISDELLSGTTVGRIPATPGVPASSNAVSAPLGLLPAPNTAAQSGAAAPAGDGRVHYRSRPDLTGPSIAVTRRSGALAPGLILFTPNNGTAPDTPTIVDNHGNPVWIGPASGQAAVNLRVATYRGEPVLTWWEGKISAGIGAGDYVIADTSYREIARVRAGNGHDGDLHEFLISPQDTAVFLVTNPVSAPVPAASPTPGSGSPAASGAAVGTVIEAIVQEVDIATGNVLFEWHSLPEIDPSESYLPVPANGTAYDYLHANSVDIDVDGNLLVSARHSWAVYKIDRASGSLLWRLNGKRSDFAMQPGAAFAWQHDARAHPDGSISVFDDGAMGPAPQFESQSRGIILAVDAAARTARLLQAFVHPGGILATSQGSFEILPDGHAFVGWGSQPQFSEFDASGRLLLDASFPNSKQSYRTLRYPWTGQPIDDPQLAVVRTGPSAIAVYASWNGATEVATWDVTGGMTESNLTSLGHAANTGFETVIQLDADALFVQAHAMDAHGRVLGLSPIVAVE